MQGVGQSVQLIDLRGLELGGGGLRLATPGRHGCGRCRASVFSLLVALVGESGQVQSLGLLAKPDGVTPKRINPTLARFSSKYWENRLGVSDSSAAALHYRTSSPLVTNAFGRTSLPQYQYSSPLGSSSMLGVR